MGRWISITVVWLFVLAGAVEAIWGLCQMYGFAYSNHSLYSMTGSFYNPGPYSGFLALTFPVCLHEWLKRSKGKKTIPYYIVLFVMLLIMSVLPAGLSRSAWIAVAIASAYVGYMDYRTEISHYILFHRKKVWIGTVLIVLFSGFALSGIYLMKKDSADGRLLMWKVATRAVAEHPWTGHGWDAVAGAYGQAQEEYFSANGYTEVEERVAGAPEYVFNEYLQVVIAWGIPVLCIILLVVGGSGYAGHRQGEYGLCGALLSLAVFAFSSYPFQFFLFIAALAMLVVACGIGCLSHKKKPVQWGAVLLLIVAGYVCFGIYRFQSEREEVSRLWHKAQVLYHSRAYQQATEEYAELHADMRWNAHFLFEYGHALHKQHRYEESNVILKEALKVSSDPMVLNIIGKNEQGMGNYELAEHWLIRSTHRLPGRIYPYYLLAKLYAEPSFFQRDKLERMVQMVLEKEPKVQSTAIKQMRQEVTKLMENVKKE